MQERPSANMESTEASWHVACFKRLMISGWEVCFRRSPPPPQGAGTSSQPLLKRPPAPKGEDSGDHESRSERNIDEARAHRIAKKSRERSAGEEPGEVDDHDHQREQ